MPLCLGWTISKHKDAFIKSSEKTPTHCTARSSPNSQHLDIKTHRTVFCLALTTQNFVSKKRDLRKALFSNYFTSSG